MKLTRLKTLGRFKNPDTGTFVNVHKGDRVGYGDAWYFYLLRGKRQFISEKDFFERWKNSKQNAELADDSSGQRIVETETKGE